MIIRALLAVALAALAAVAGAGYASLPASVTASYNVYQNGLPVAVVQEAFEKSGGKYRDRQRKHPGRPAGHCSCAPGSRYTAAAR